jgi:aminoglycoside phosphotransferase (APT) family kinase protein
VLQLSRSVRLSRWLAGTADAGDVSITSAYRVWGGSNHDTWRVAAILRDGPHAGPCELAIRVEARQPRPSRLTLQQEAAVMRAVRRAGLPAPEPLWFCGDSDVIGRPFLVVPWLAGTSDRQLIAEMTRETDGGRALVQSLGAHLARLHAISPCQPGLAFLDRLSPQAVHAQWDNLHIVADAAAGALPELGAGLRWVERHMPEPTAQVLAHGDFGTGNYLVADGAVTAILDWEKASYADRHMDVAGFWAKAWRRKDWGARDADPTLRRCFHEGYRLAGGGAIDDTALRYWEVMSHLRSAAAMLSRIPAEQTRIVRGALARRAMDALDQVARLIA